MSETLPTFRRALPLAAGVLAGLALAAGVAAYRRPHPRAPLWVLLETRSAAPDVRFLGVRLRRAYTDRRRCLRSRRPSGLVTLGHETYRRFFYCVEVFRE